jgi:hypothetical protein
MLVRLSPAVPILLALLTPAVLVGQATPRDFHFESSDQTTVALNRQSVFEATINGKGPFKLFFDTGAGVNILNPEVIAQLDLTSAGQGEQLHGLSGGKVEAKPYRADELRIGNLTLTGQTFYSVPMPLPRDTQIVGAVGYELMSRLMIKADYARHQLSLFDPERFTDRISGERLELLQDERQLVAHLRVGKAAGDFVLDTGAIGKNGILVAGWFTRQNHLLRRFGRHYRGVFSGGADGNAPPASLERIRAVCLGVACVPGVVGEFSDDATKSQYAGRVGLELLSRFTLTIDWQHRAIYLDKAPQWDEPVVYDQTGLLANPSGQGTELTVVGIYPHSPASRARIKAGDRILLIDNRPPEPTWYGDDPAFLQPAGTLVALTIQRGNTSLRIQLKLKDIL